MLADLDLLLIAVFCAADDLLPAKPANARRMVTDPEVVTLCVAQAIMGIPSDARFLKVARKRLTHLFPKIPQRSGFHKRRDRLSDTIEELIAAFARDCPGFHDDLVLVDPTPVECARSIETSRRSELAAAADYGYCASHSRYFWGFRLHGLFALDGTPRALTSPRRGNATYVSRCSHASNDRAGSLLSATRATPAVSSSTPPATSTPAFTVPAAETNLAEEPNWAPIRQRIESIFQTCKDLLTLERHGARTLHGLRTHINARFLTLAAAISLNHRLGRPPRALTDYTA